MPSKTKKHSKIQSRLSSSERPASPLTPSLTPTSDSNISEEDLLSYLEEASRKYPSLIGKSAFIGEVCDVESESKGCKIWLSESSMVAYSLCPGSLVSVSLASSRNKRLHSFPLNSLADECARCFGLDTEKIVDNEFGNYFALATVFPSSKVLKNGARLSSNLSYTMGCPISGAVLFVYLVCDKNLSVLVNGIDKPYHTKDNSFSVHYCKELYLKLAPPKNGSTMENNFLYSKNFSNDKTYVRSENEIVASPKTPFYESKIRSTDTSQLTPSITEDLVSNVLNHKNPSMESVDMREALSDESTKRLLQTFATSWLCSRCLLLGNLVTVPMLSELYVFEVIDAKKVLAERSNHYSTNERSDLYPKDFDIVDRVNDVFVINQGTKVHLSLASNIESGKPMNRDFSGENLEDKLIKARSNDNTPKLGGLSEECAVLKEIISSSVADTLSRFGLRTTKGVLLHGPPGTGKSSLARFCAHDVGVNLFVVNGPEIVSQYYGESEQALHEVFHSASQAAPAVVLIDELDAIAPARKDGGEELSQRMVATLLNLMDGISRNEGLLVVAATNRPDNIDPALRRPGRLDKEIEIGVPSPKQRLDILLTLLSEVEHSLSDMHIEHLATITHGFVGADLASLCNEAALVCLRSYVNFKKSSDTLKNSRTSTPCEGCSNDMKALPVGLKDTMDNSQDLLAQTSSSVSDLSDTSELGSSICIRGTAFGNVESIYNDSEKEHVLKVAFEDFEKARMKVRPSAMREVILEVPKVNWEDVGGQREVKSQLMEAVEWPQKHHDAFKRIGTRPPTGVLMFGPPGCSKTLMARAVASEARLNFLAVKGPELFSKWVGESEKAVRSLFAKARANAPSIIFFDEIDGLAVIRGKENDGVSVSDRVMSQLLVELDGLHQRVDVTVIAATNRPDKIDPALLRPGRFDRLLYVGPPNEIDREEIFRIHLRKIPFGSDVSIKELAYLTGRCTGADISLICREAAVAALEESLSASEITMQHLKVAIRQIQPSEIQSYQHLSAKFQRLVQHSDIEVESRYMQHSRTSLFSIWSSISSLLYQFTALVFHFKTAPSG